MKLKSKSSLFNNIISQADDQLASIPLTDYHGTPLEDSLDFDMHVDGIKMIKVKDGEGHTLQPFSTLVATKLVYDELTERREQEKNGGK